MTTRRRAIGTGVVAGLLAAGLVGGGIAATGAGIGGGSGSSSPSSENVTAVRLAARAAAEGLQSRYLTVGTARRHYLLYVPPSVARTHRPAPLVLAFHGLHLSAAWMATSTGLVRAADRAGVVLALPDAVHGAWNDGRLGRHGPDDLDFATSLVRSLVAEDLADPQRVTVSGYSNGAELALVLAARDPQLFSAVVSVSGAMPALPGTPRPSHVLPAYFTHGTADPVQPWNGRPTRNELHPALISEQATVDAFVAADHADPVARQVPTGSARVEQFVWRARAGGAPVVLYRLVGAGHGWPSRPGTCSDVVCGGALDAAALVVHVATSSPPSLADRS